MFAKVVWKMALFAVSVFILLLTLGYGQDDYHPTQSWDQVGGQAKVAQPNARTAGFKSVAPPPAPKKTIWDTIRDTTNKWLGGGSMTSVGAADAGKSELQKLQSRTKAGSMAPAINSSEAEY